MADVRPIVYNPIPIAIGDVMKNSPLAGFSDYYTPGTSDWKIVNFARAIFVGMYAGVCTALNHVIHKTTKLQHDLDKVVDRVAKAQLNQNVQTPEALQSCAELYGRVDERGVRSGGLIPKLIDDVWKGIEAQVEAHMKLLPNPNLPEGPGNMSIAGEIADPAAKAEYKKRLLQAYLLNLPLDTVFEQLWSKVTDSIRDGVGVDHFQNKYNRIRLLHDLKAGLEERFQQEVIQLIDTSVSESPDVLSNVDHVEHPQSEQYVQWMFDQSVRLGKKFMENLKRIESGQDLRVAEHGQAQHAIVDELVEDFENHHGRAEVFAAQTGIEVGDSTFEDIIDSFTSDGIRERMVERLKAYRDKHLGHEDVEDDVPAALQDQRDRLVQLQAYNTQLQAKFAGIDDEAEALTDQQIQALPTYLRDQLVDPVSEVQVDALKAAANQARREALHIVTLLIGYFGAAPAGGRDPLLTLICQHNNDPHQVGEGNPFTGYHTDAAQFITLRRQAYRAAAPMEFQDRNVAFNALQAALHASMPHNDAFNPNTFLNNLLDAEDEAAFRAVIDRLPNDNRVAAAQAANGVHFNNTEGQDTALQAFRQSKAARRDIRTDFPAALRAHNADWGAALTALQAQLAPGGNLPDDLADLAVPGDVYEPDDEANIEAIHQAILLENELDQPISIKTKLSAHRQAQALLDGSRVPAVLAEKVRATQVVEQVDAIDPGADPLPVEALTAYIGRKREAFDRLIELVEPVNENEDDPLLDYQSLIKRPVAVV